MKNNTATEITVIARFSLKTGTREEFITFASEDSEKSLKNEKGCTAFDILVPEEDDHSVVLYEIYTDRDAFNNHKNMPHYQPFIDGTTPLLNGEPDVRIFKNLSTHYK